MAFPYHITSPFKTLPTFQVVSCSYNYELYSTGPYDLGEINGKACNVGYQGKRVISSKGFAMGILIQRWVDRLYVAYNKECLNHVYACMYQCGLEKNHGKF